MQKGNKLIVINSAPYETRVATLESGVLVDFLLERGDDRNIIGNIYKGKVIRILPGMQAAFVDIGMEKSAFLYVGDVLDPEKRYEDVVGEVGRGFYQLLDGINPERIAIAAEAVGIGRRALEVLLLLKYFLMEMGT